MYRNSEKNRVEGVLRKRDGSFYCMERDNDFSMAASNGFGDNSAKLNWRRV